MRLLRNFAFAAALCFSVASMPMPGPEKDEDMGDILCFRDGLDARCPGDVHIHPAYNHGDKCLDVTSSNFANGTPLQIWDCNRSSAQDWVYNRGWTTIRLDGTNFCLDAGSNPGAMVIMKIWQCIGNLPAQTWIYRGDDHFELAGTGLCIDLPYGDVTPGNKVQTWPCIDGNIFQVWTGL